MVEGALPAPRRDIQLTSTYRSRIIKPASAQEQSREPSPDAASAAEDDALEQDQEDETEIQPAHRAEALDTLAIIELKFALLRENVYVEKMDNLAWEEALVNDGARILVSSMASFAYSL